jgi:hypothetical protein
MIEKSVDSSKSNGCLKSADNYTNAQPFNNVNPMNKPSNLHVICA